MLATVTELGRTEMLSIFPFCPASSWLWPVESYCLPLDFPFSHPWDKNTSNEKTVVRQHDVKQSQHPSQQMFHRGQWPTLVSLLALANVSASQTLLEIPFPRPIMLNISLKICRLVSSHRRSQLNHRFNVLVLFYFFFKYRWQGTKNYTNIA